MTPPYGVRSVGRVGENPGNEVDISEKKKKKKREDERAMEILRKKTEEVSYPLGETDQHEDQSKDILNSILKEELSDTDSEALIKELN